MYLIEFIIAWLKSMSKFRVILLFLNLFFILASMNKIYESGYFSSKYYYQEAFIEGFFI